MERGVRALSAAALDDKVRESHGCQGEDYSIRCLVLRGAPPFISDMNFRRLAAVAAIAAMILPLAPRPALAWDDLGHMVITRIAWSQLAPRTRERVIALLAQAPADAGIAELRPAAGDSLSDLMFAAYASTWADIIRRPEPAAHHAYHHGNWHYINYYWSTGPDGNAVPSTMLLPDSVNIVTELTRESRIVRDSAASGADRAVALAWVLHLAGDIAQPLHASARVTAEEPQGDRGGNTVTLEPKMSLHWYWDRVLSARYPREPGETQEAYVARVSAEVEARTPRAKVAARIAPADFDLWARESLTAAEREVYCCGIAPGAPAPESYLQHADAVAEPAIALAGYRLADLLTALVGG
jgi:hypothetical protein